MNWRVIIILSIFSITAISTIAQKVIYTELINQKQLPVSQVQQIFQDSEGYMWYGTSGGGICRDDGYTVNVFRSDFNTPELLESNWIKCISEDTKNRIWFGTKRGLYILDKNTYQIAEISDKDIKHWDIDAILASRDGSIWVSAANLIIRYDTYENKLSTYSVKWKGELRKTTQFYEDRNNTIWIVQWHGGVFQFNNKANEFISFNWPFNVSPTCILQDAQSEKYWISTWGKGFVEFNPNANTPDQMYNIQEFPFDEYHYSRRHILGLAQDYSQYNIWTLTMDYLFSYESLGNNNVLPAVLTNNLHLDKKMLNQVITDKYGNLWIASDYPCSYVVSFHTNQISLNQVTKMNEYHGVPLAPLTFIKSEELYWFWQNRNGLFLYDSNNDILTNISHQPNLIRRKKSPILEKTTNTDGIYTLLDDTELALLKFDNNSVLHTTKIAELPSNERAHVLYADHSSNLWIGTNNNLYKCNLKTNKLTKIGDKKGVINDIITINTSIFLATEKLGLCIIENENEFQCFGENENFISVALSPDSTIWAGTQQGDVFYFDSDNNQLVSIKEIAGLNGDAIIQIETDNSGLIWILTNQRIIIYNPASKSSNVIFSSDPSISMNNFISLFKDEHGIVHVGGTGGFCSFPFYSDFKYVDSELPVKLTSININGNSKLVGVNENKIVLQPNEKNVEIFFSTLNPLDAEKIRFAFKYKGENEYWNYLPEGHNNIFLTNMASGDYYLQVKATNAKGQFNKHFTDFHIQRLPDWYETTFAFIIYLIVSFIFITLSISYYLNWKKRKLVNQQIHNSAIDLQVLASQLSEDILEPTSSGSLNLKDLLLNMKEILQRQKEQKENISKENSTNENDLTLSASDERFIQNALNFVELNLDNTNYTVEQLSFDLGVDRTGLYRKLVSIIGKTPTSFIRSIRLKRAAHLLEDGYTVAETADRVGFGTSSYLSKCFREEYGVKPSDYISSFKQKRNVSKTY